MSVTKTLGLSILLALWLGFVFLLITAFIKADFWEEAPLLTEILWGWVTLGDLYLGFAFICAWILYRDGFSLWSALWCVAVMLLGNLTTGAYLLIRLAESKGDIRHLLLGRNIT